MIKLIHSELLKMNGTFSKKLIVIGPLFTLTLGCLLSGKLVQLTAYNWWYTMILPIIFSVWCASIIRRENNTQYQNIVCLPIDMKRIWAAKILTIFILLYIMSLIMFLGGVLFGFFTVTNISPINGFIGNVLLFSAYLWQVPLIMFVTWKIGYMPTVLLSIVGNFVFPMLGSEKSWFFINPFAILARVVCPIFKIRPNGLSIEKGSPLLDVGAIFPAISISLILAVISFILTTKFFMKGEEKHDGDVLLYSK